MRPTLRAPGAGRGRRAGEGMPPLRPARGAAVALALTLVLSAVAFTALFWGIALIAQGYLYGQPADKLPLRALVAGLAVALYMTVWNYANTPASHEDKDGTGFTFTPTATKEVSELEADRQVGKSAG